MWNSLVWFHPTIITMGSLAMKAAGAADYLTKKMACEQLFRTMCEAVRITHRYYAPQFSAQPYTKSYPKVSCLR